MSNDIINYETAIPATPGLSVEQIEELHNALQMAWCEYTRNSRYAQREDSLRSLTQLRDMALAHLRSPLARTYSDMSIVELLRERGRIDFALHFKVCGDQSKGITMPASPPAGE